MNTPAAHGPRKRFGQHFLADHAVVAQILAAIDAQAGERIVEIGPGEGALTLPLLRWIGALTAIEIDRDLIPRLHAAAAGLGRLELIEADALTVDFSALAGGQTLRVVGNLPYNISTPLLFHLLEHAAVLRDMHFMLQKEVVERMAAGPGSKVYGRLSVMLQVRCMVEPLFEVPPGAFRPPPQVQSAVVRLTPLPASAVAPDQFADFEAVVRAGFAKRRKTLRNALHGLLSAAQIAAAGVDPGARAETIAPAGWIALAQASRNH